jgi:hypothetical protein
MIQSGSNVKGEGAKCLTYHLISRRGCMRGGTRFKHRGVDQYGYVANFVETEQIIGYSTSEKKQISSQVMVRGSVPVLWEQKNQNAPIEFVNNQKMHRQYMLMHLAHLTQGYGDNIYSVNLLNMEKKYEGELCL